MKRLFFFWGLPLMIACAEEVIEKPENLLAKETMVDMYYDLAILKSLSSTNPTVFKENDIEIMPFLYEKHGTDSLQFAQSDLYYASLPLEYQNMYENVEARLEERGAYYKEQEQKRKDSIKESRRKADSIAKPPPKNR